MSAIEIVDAAWFAEMLPTSDGIEIAPVQSVTDTVVEQCPAEEAEFWAVYLHLKDGHVSWVANYATKAGAERYARQLLRGHAHLQKFGIVYG